MKYESYTNRENQRILDDIQSKKNNKQNRPAFKDIFKIILICALICSLCLNLVMLYKNINLHESLESFQIDKRALELNVVHLKKLNEEYEKELILISDYQNDIVGASSNTNAFDDWSEGEDTVFVRGAELPWYLVLVNYENQVADDFKVELEAVGTENFVDKRVAAQLEKMIADGTNEGLDFEICSSYRNMEKQMKLFQTFINELKREGYTYEKAFFKANRTSAIPGYSEHHTGLAVDIVSKSYKGLDRKQAQTEEFKWLEKNCYKYGFILRYPVAKYNITGIDYEPWHFRYVGESVAEYITNNNITLEEYLEQHIEASKNLPS